MKKLLLLFFFPLIAFAQAMPPMEEKEDVVTMNVAPITKSNSESVIVIMPKDRAGDYKDAFEMLRKEKTSNKLFFKLKSGYTINNIIEVNLVGSGTLLMFKYNSMQGVKYNIVAVEDIESIYHE